MKYHLVCVRDRASDAFGAPQSVASIGGAIRGFADEVNRDAADNQFNKHPEDFDLYVLGTYDDSDGSFDVAAPRQVAIGKDLRVRSNGSGS